MNDLFLGNYIAGNFSPKESVAKGDYTIEKRDNILYLINGKSSIQLTPIDNDAKLVVHNFSTDLEFNETIYDVQFAGENIVIVLYTYSSTQKLLGSDQKISIHLLREAEKKICSKDGYEDHYVDSSKDIVPYLTDLFINNKSIFVHLDKKNPDAFQMFGRNGIRVNVRRERPGVYCIDRFYKTRNKDYSFDLTQLYGNIEFVLWQDSISISGVGATRLEAVRTNEVFRAWNEYMDFEKRIYEDELRSRGVIRYSGIETDGEQLIFTLDDPVSDEQINGVEFEFYSAFSDAGGRPLPKTTEELILLKQTDKRAGIYLGQIKNDGSIIDKLVFDIPRFGFVKDMEMHGGIIYVSDHGIQVEQNRRKRVLKLIESKQNETSNIIMRLSQSDIVDDQLGTTFNPTSSEVLKKMFGNPNVTLKETYREAMYIALNTPDIALIQGPPGTGKTTLIKGLITKLNKDDCRILVSSEQHEALYNVVDKLSQNKFIPPFVSSRRHDSDNGQDDTDRFEKNIREFQQSFIALCNDLLREGNIKERRSAKITSLIYEIQKIRDNGYSSNYILSVIDSLKTQVIELGSYDALSADFLALEQIVKLPKQGSDIEDLDFATKQIIRKIESQRTEIDVFLEDDGERQLQDLQRVLQRNEYDDLCLDSKLLSSLLSGDEKTVQSVFEEYISYVASLKDKFLLTTSNDFDEVEAQSAKDIIERIASGIAELTKSTEPTFFDVIEGLAFKLGDIDNAAGIIGKYTTIVGSTCAQAEKSVELMDLPKDRYDYVIIDEAARANPLDIMIPMMMGTKVILIGDHKQLPHYIESKYVDKFKSEKEQYSEYDEKLLTKSLFQIIYENLETAYKEGRLKFRRTIQIDEQHRMHPTIGSFISREFYDGTIQNGERTVNNKNDYRMFDGKNVVWIDMPIFKGAESSYNHSYARECEVDRIIELIKQFLSNNEGRKLDIGIISFYKGQVNLIDKRLKESFPTSVLENISCNTVDSYQGKEFDIVIISGTRSNTHADSRKSLGFIDCSASRINVALSRARKVLVMVADADTYRRNSHFSNFIEYVKDEGYYGI